MSLLDFQTVLGRSVREPGGEGSLGALDIPADERAALVALIESPGFRFTVEVQRSWSVGRAAKAARLTLSMLPPEQTRQILEEWVSVGGGTASFFATEADAFLDFVAEHLPDPSHALTICRLEQATLRASEAARRFTAPELSGLALAGRMLQVGRHAALVRFHGEPHLILAALEGHPLPPLSSAVVSLLFAPGLDRLFREATGEEIALWERLVEPVKVTSLFREGHRREAIEALILAGGAEFRGMNSSFTPRFH